MRTYIKRKYAYMISYPQSDRYAIKYGAQCNEGWYPLIKDMLDIIYKLDIRKEVKIFQIKEKFGQFRFYYNDTEVSNQYIKEVVTVFTIKINKTCEQCGMPGSLNTNEERHKTLCSECINIKE